MRIYRSWLPAWLLATAVLPGLAQAASITVDETTCTLSNAITSANDDTATGGCAAGSGADTITLATDVTLSAALPNITSTITVEGGGHFISGNNDSNVGSVLYNSGNLTLNKTTVKEGIADAGGGIHNEGTLTLKNSTVSNNTGAFGGGIYSFGNATIIVTITNSTVSNNTASFSNPYGGGIYNEGTLLNITNSTVSGNTASSTAISNNSSGGGICNFYSTVTITNSTISHNGIFAGATSFSGGIANFYGTVDIINSTVSDNTAASSYAASGGGLYNEYGIFTLTNTTVSGNTASAAIGSSGGGLSNNGGFVTLYSSLVSGNIANTSGYEIFSQNGGTITAASFNVFGHSGESNALAFAGPDAFLPSGSDVNATSDGTATALEVILNPTLADNGGLTETLALPEGSPAIDLDTTCNGGLITTDQRGYSRPVGLGCDAGAFEYNALPVTKKGKLIPVYKLLLLKDGE